MKDEIQYTSEGPCGYVIYKDEDGEIRLFYEFGGGDCVTIIYLPGVLEWTKKTGRPAEERNKLIDHILALVIRDKAPGCQIRKKDSVAEIIIAQ